MKNEAARRHPSAGANVRNAPLVPKQPPPRVVKRFNPETDLPEVGTWVAVTTKRETMTGRVVIVEPTRVRLLQGAGWWEIPVETIQRIEKPEDPREKNRKNSKDTTPDTIAATEIIEVED